MEPPETPTFTVEDVSVGPHAHGFGRTAEGNSYAFRVRKSTLFVEVYRADAETDVPAPDDIIATARRSIREIDLTDERSIVAVVRDAVSTPDSVVVGQEDGRTVRAVLSRLGAVIDGL
ncbi:hypothetical protein [Rhodococcus tibetensis]|uniref:Uncharacterized protein n=1 Tax=Rhodococcus tibetensis TaxID=2965064 RepID=A0ABT1QCZ0_9NOCA|nr:hypothetical protein [Rhodococcus sp. FXJ9.536]MCQ4120110.1 hypothetical protein [Rhodococcus sp. FXJ9.536]